MALWCIVCEVAKDASLTQGMSTTDRAGKGIKQDKTMSLLRSPKRKPYPRPYFSGANPKFRQEGLFWRV